MRLLVLACTAAMLSPACPVIAANGFDVVTLGALGGIQGGNLSTYLIHPHGDWRGVTCDAGTLVNGLRVADEKGAFNEVKVPAGSPVNRVGYVLTQQIRGYLVSHAHLDHVAGLIIASPGDSKKPVYGLPSVNGALVESYFNWQAWPNMTDRGKAPQLKRYLLMNLEPGKPQALHDTNMNVTAFVLDHGGVESTAFLIESDGDAILCVGDTGPDEIQKSTRMRDLWTSIAPLAKAKKLKAILIEASYTSDRPDNLLFGHLTPKWILKSLRDLDAAAGGKALSDLPIIVAHIKYALAREQPRKRIRDELEAENDLGVRFILPEQGTRWHLR